MSATYTLPREAFAARRHADPAIAMRVVTRADPRVLPENPHELIKGAVPVGGRVAIVIALIVVTIGFPFGMWFIAEGGLEEYGLWWVVFWMLFPLPFLVPLVGLTVYGLRRSRRAWAAIDDYIRIRQGTRPVDGVVREVVVGTSEGDVSYLVARIGFEQRGRSREAIAYGRADILQTEVPPVGSLAHLWLDAADAVRVVQIAAGSFGVPGEVPPAQGQ